MLQPPDRQGHEQRGAVRANQRPHVTIEAFFEAAKIEESRGGGTSVFAMRGKTYTHAMYGLWSADSEAISLGHSRTSFPHCVHTLVLIDFDTGNTEWFRFRARRQVPVWPVMRHRRRDLTQNPPSPKSGVFAYDRRFASSYGMNRLRTKWKKPMRRTTTSGECRP